MKNSLRFSLLIAFLFVMGGFGILRANAAWQGPTENPPGGNVSAPINVSNVAQVKEGGLTIGGTVFGQAFTVETGGNLKIDVNKFTVTALTGNTSIAGTLTVTGDASFGSAGLKNLTVNDTFLVKDSTDTKDLFKVDGASGGEDEVRVGVDASTSGMFQVQSKGGVAVPAILGLKPSGFNGSAIIARNSDANNGALYAENDEGSGIVAKTGVEKYGAVVGKSTKGAPDLTKAKEYSAGVRGESDIDDSGVEAIAGVLGIGSDLLNYKDDNVRSFGVVGAGGDVTTPVSGSSTRLTAGVYGKAGNIESSILQAVTYGVFGKSGLVNGSGTSWAGYFDGNVNVTETISSERLKGSITGPATEAVGTFTYDDLTGWPVTLVEVGAENIDDTDQRRFGIRMNSPLALMPLSVNQSPNKQLVFDAYPEGYDTYFTYNTSEQCLELWMSTNDLGITKTSPAGSWIAQEWGDLCTGPCQGDCYRVGSPNGSCPQMGDSQKSGKCAQQEGLNYIKCCGPTPP